MPYHTPLRYPGGKRRLSTVVQWLIKENGLEGKEYIEPYAGGAAVALALLNEGWVSGVHLNDLSRPVYAFWHSVLNKTDELCAGINAVQVTMDEWYRQRAVFDRQEEANLLELGLATFFLNRTNRSGILSGGVLGGKEQKGEYRLDCRFNKRDLIQRILAIAALKDSIQLYQMDAAAFCKDILGASSQDAFVFLDPPYLTNGEGLYLNEYNLDQHKALAQQVQTLSQLWICTYDLGAIEAGLFAKQRRVEYKLPYVAQGRHRGHEVMFLSDRLTLPDSWLVGGVVQITPKGSNYELMGTFVSRSTQPYGF